MEAKELRIGNYIYQETVFVERQNGETIKIRGSYKEVDAHILGNAIDGKIDEQPIPLTEEWLLKFGIKYDENEETTYLNPYVHQIEYNKTDEVYDIFVEITEHTYTASVKYLHQLQNLYFALTGEELILE